MKILITGANGQLGRELMQKCAAAGYQVLGTDVQQLDITQTMSIENCFLHFKPTIVVNAAAYTFVDKAEKETELAYSINAAGPGNLAGFCNDYDIPLIHISTDYVFNGAQSSPYIESARVCPESVYGKSKAEGEKKVISGCKKHIIIRISWLYGVYGSNFVKTMLRLSEEKQNLSIVSDQYGCPTSAFDVANAVVQIIRLLKNKTFKSGIYHYSGRGITTWFDFAKTIFAIASSYTSIKIPNIIPIKTEDYPSPAKRPLFSVLDCSKIKNELNIDQKPWNQSLEKDIKRIFTEL